MNILIVDRGIKVKLLICGLDGAINGSSDARADLVIIEDCPKNIAAIRRGCSDLVPKIYAINVAKFTCNQ